MGNILLQSDALLIEECMETYKRAATALFHDMMHKEVEVYVDDMMVKSETREGHFEALDKFLARLEKYNLRLNPKKYVFGKRTHSQ